MRKYTTLLLDADDTLLNFAQAESRSIRLTCEEFGIPFSAEIGQAYSKINDALWKQLEKGNITRGEIRTRRFVEFVKHLGVSADPIAMADKYITLLSESGDIIDGADRLCEKLSRQYDLYMVTNGTTWVQKERLARSNIMPYFKGCFISEEMGTSKPAKIFFDKVFEEIGLDDLTKVCIIGDSLSSDIKGGMNAGIDTCYFGKRRDTLSPCPTYIAETFDDILELFCYEE